MANETYDPTDRRPIASREHKVWQELAAYLAAHRVSPNAISVWGMVVGVIAGSLLAATGFTGPGWAQRVLFLSGATCIQLRLLANMLDGMVAVATQKASQLGELYNELPDRASDIAIIIGAGYAAGGLPIFGYLAACVAVLTAYIRAVGKAAGASNLFVGPMAKPHRMFVLTVVSILMGCLPASWQPSWGESHAGLLAVGLAFIIIAGLLTFFRRLNLIVRHLRGPA